MPGCYPGAHYGPRTGLGCVSRLLWLCWVVSSCGPFLPPLYYCGCGCLVPWFLGGFGGVCANLTQAQMQAHGPKKTAQKAKGHACNSKKGTALSGYCCVAVENYEQSGVSGVCTGFLHRRSTGYAQINPVQPGAPLDMPKSARWWHTNTKK